MNYRAGNAAWATQGAGVVLVAVDVVAVEPVGGEK